jgi:GAF domain-containing protein
VFDAIVLTAARLFRRDMAFMLACNTTSYWPVATAAPEGLLTIPHVAPVPIDTDANFPSRVILTRKNLHLPDWSAVELPEYERMVHETMGINSALYLPLLREGECIGLLGIAGKRAGIFDGSEILLAESFRDQALIAIENTRLFNETREALERQNASAEILRTIASAPGDAERALYQIAETSARLFGAPSATIHIAEGDGWARTIRFGASSKNVGAGVPESQLKIGGHNMPGTIVGDNRQVHVPDLDHVDPAIADWPGLPYVREAGTRSMSGSPLRREGKAIGALIVYRDRLAPFSAEELAVQQTFADQAAIAIENARLFNETKEALERQTATADILKVIASSPSDVQPVFEAIAKRANSLIGGFSSTVFRFIDGVAHLEAFTPTSPAADEVLQATFPRPVTDFPPFQMAQAGEVTRIPDTEALSDELLTISRARGFRSMLFAPLVNEGVSIGFIAVTRVQPGSFADHHVQLLQTFADQAVIAIENARLFEEVQAKTRDLTEALTYQTGSSNILKVIASSPTDVAPVLRAIVESACELCEADDAVLHLRQGDQLVYAAHQGSIPVGLQKRAISRDFVTGRSVVDKVPVHLHDVFSSEGAEFPEAREMSRGLGTRTLLSVPLLRENESIGAIVLRRTEVQPFTDKQIALLQTFADQAVIALGNVRLFDEVQARTRDLTESLQQQTATADVLKVISASPGELQPVFQAMLENAVRLCEAKFAMLFFYEAEGNQFRAVGNWNLPQAWSEFLGKNAIRADPMIPLGQVVTTKQPVQVLDVLADQSYIGRYPGMVGVAELGGARTLLQVPMLRENELVGSIGIYRQEVRPFTDKQIALVRNFAAQAVIAIENARLLNELRQRTDDLSNSLEDLRTAQDRLVQTEKLASLGQLTAGIAHEIKNPLNFVNNFAALSAELTDELNEVLAPVAFDDKIREEVNELTHTLKNNLEKVVQHGKRADSIVKNMLLHSREGSGDHRPADINALLDESLNLAYHGARAERREFNVTLQRDFDEMAGSIEVFPQEITRVFLNLIANGFYAVTKRKSENGASGFEPVLCATTKNLGDTVEIRIRDNGTGIPAEVREKMFNPFFTTKPAGEGTGLGLSMSHDIIVKQHGGRIDVETEPGHFTEFTIVLPRISTFSNKIRG